MAEPEIPVGFEDALRAGLAELAADAPLPAEAHLDDLESLEPRPASGRPGRPGTRVIAVAAVVITLVAVAAVALRPGRDGDTVHTGVGDQTCTTVGTPIPVPDRYADEARLLVPLRREMSVAAPTGSPTVEPGAAAAQLQYPDGTVLRITAAPGDAADAAPGPFPTTRAEAQAELTDLARTVTSGMTATGRVATASITVDVPRTSLESMARATAELPETMARAIARNRALPLIDQSFAIGSEAFDRTVEQADGTTLIDHRRTSGDAPDQGAELAMLVGASRPEIVSEFDQGGRLHWLVFIPAGLRVRIDRAGGDGCTAAVADELTGGEYWLVRDGDGDEAVTTETSTTGRPTTFDLTRAPG